ncbi:MAG: hypothetical protein IKK59_05535 [Lachnospiraceae bacterium]|nr:hypothetical protein [Lachnospiraceae bacterium]
MRKIETHDVFKMARIIKDAGIKKEIEEIFANANIKDNQNTESVQERLGVKIVFSIIEGCSSEKLEDMLYDFVAGVSEKNTEDIKHMSLDALVELFKEMASLNNMTNFFNTAGRLAQK